MKNKTDHLNPLCKIQIADFILCESCGFLERLNGRSRSHYHCPNCGADSSHTRAYFPNSAFTLVDLMHNFYQRDLDQENYGLGVVLSFCSFTEVLLQNFLMNRMLRMRIPIELQDRLLDDNQYMSQRIEKLFPILIGRKWRDALSNIKTQKTESFLSLDDLYQSLAQAKNLFLHRGNKAAISPEMITKAIESIPAILDMFAALHQRYVFRELNQKVSH